MKRIIRIKLRTKVCVVGNDVGQCEHAVIVIVLVRRVGVACAIAVPVAMLAVAGVTLVVVACLFAGQTEAYHVPVMMVGNGGMHERQQECERDEPAGNLCAKLHASFFLRGKITTF